MLRWNFQRLIEIIACVNLHFTVIPLGPRNPEEKNVSVKIKILLSTTEISQQ